MVFSRYFYYFYQDLGIFPCRHLHFHEMYSLQFAQHSHDRYLSLCEQGFPHRYDLVSRWSAPILYEVIKKLLIPILNTCQKKLFGMNFSTMDNGYDVDYTLFFRFYLNYYSKAVSPSCPQFGITNLYISDVLLYMEIVNEVLTFFCNKHTVLIFPFTTPFISPFHPISFI